MKKFLSYFRESKKYFWYICIFITFSILLISCKDDVNYGNPPNGNNSDNRPVEYTTEFKIAFGYTPYYDPNYRPLGNSPTPAPYSITDIFNAYNTIGFSNLQKFDRDLTINDNQLVMSNLTTIKDFYIAYKVANNLNNAPDEYDKLCLFGITRMRNDLGNGNFGISYKLKELEYDQQNHKFTPSICFVFSGKADSTFKSLGYSDVQRKKIIVYSAIHELGHGRGLVDLSNTADVHNKHYDPINTNALYCVMNWPSVQDLNYIFPPFFCQKHKNYLKDSLVSKIISGLYMKP